MWARSPPSCEHVDESRVERHLAASTNSNQLACGKTDDGEVPTCLGGDLRNTRREQERG